MKKCIIFTFLIIITIISGAVNFPLEEVTQGLEGIGKTVFSGTLIEEFPVEIMGLVPGEGLIPNYVLFRIGGKALDLGGIAEGMSGSPVYVDGKLLGAISHGFNDLNHELGLITPIEYMEKLLDLPVNQRPEPEIKKNDKLEAAPLNTPLFVSGLGPRSRSFLEKQLGYPLSSGLNGAGGEMPELSSKEIVPGGVLGVQLAKGDVSIGSFGTITNVYDDERFLAFGHSIFGRGTTSLLATSGYIHTVVSGQAAPFKLASFGQTTGIIKEDRSAGVLGVIGKPLKMANVKISARDLDLRRQTTTCAEVITDNILVSRLISGIVLEGFDRGIDRVGSGTAKVRFTITGEGLPYPLERTNYFYTYADVGALSLSEIAEVLDLLLYNDYYDIKIKDVAVEAEFTEAKNTAVITGVTFEKQQVSPGEEVPLEVQIRPFRGEARSIKATLKIPEDAFSGSVHVVIRPGSSVPAYDIGTTSVTQKLELQSEERIGVPLSQEAQDWEKVLKDFMNREKNNQIVVEFYPPYDDLIIEDDALIEMPSPVQLFVETAYVMEGDAAGDLEIMEKQTAK